jgi:glycosyltransferase involved in cell wall biosynthesis
LDWYPGEKLIVVDDGSEDATATVARRFGVEVIRHSENRGKGAALKSGLNAGFQKGWDWALTLDADLQHRPQDIREFLNWSGSSDIAILVGQRLRQGTKMPWHRRLSNSLTTWAISRLAQQPVFDAQCGFRAYRLDVACRYPEEGRFEWESRVLVLCSRWGYGISPVPVATVYAQEGSHMRLVADTLRFMIMAWRLAWMR